MINDALVMVGRQIRHIPRVPEKLAAATFQPLVFVVLFAYVFGSGIQIPGVDYKEFLMAGIFVQTMIFGCMNTSVGLSTDMKAGLIDRFRSLPMSRSAVLFGRTVGDTVESCIGLTVMVLCGLLVGWRIRGSFLEAIAGFALLILINYTFAWLGALLGIVIKEPSAIPATAGMVIFPLTFVANTFVQPDGMPGWLKWVAQHNPVSSMVQALRELFGNTGTSPLPDVWVLQHSVLAAVIWCVLILAVSWPLAVRAYRKA
ncbi:ABC transporter permease [Pseudonocardiaceae bacterium YIM PH 21723]|nr:ABC transporter permease [Pseudonocardiaceae bacterium YIM PH 21723]